MADAKPDFKSNQAMQVLEETREMGMLIGKGGIDNSVLRIKPPMCITSADADYALDVFHEAFTAAEKNG